MICRKFPISIFLLLVLSSSALAQEVVEKIVAAIDGDPISATDVREYARTVSEEPINDEAGLKRFLKEFIAQQVIEKEAKEAGLGVSEDEMSAYIAEIKRQNNVDDKAFAELLRQKGISMESYRKQISADILRSRIVTSRLRSKINVSDGDIDRWLEAHPEEFPEAGQIKLIQAFVSAGDDAAAKIEAIRDKVKDGASLEEAAGEFYQDLGFVQLSDLLPEILQAVEDLEPGELSETVETARGLYLLKIEQRSEGTKSVSAERREAIRNQLTQEKLREEADKYLSDELPKKYNVEIKL